ncbi:MAG TPA: thermonuclease family protein [Nitrososphaera sp.]|nr:thermonuclease family protein [Nitrososphaera sp.]
MIRPLIMVICAVVIFIPTIAYATSGPAIGLSKPMLKSVIAPGTNGVQVGQQVIISTTVARGYEYESAVPYVVLLEVRDSDSVTEFISFQSGKLEDNIDEQIEVGTTWIPAKAGTFSLRAFAISDFENPQILSFVYESAVEINSVAICSGSAECIRGVVTKIVDGDTLDIGGTRIRLAMVNTPETGEAGYDAAKEFTETLCHVGSQAVADEDDSQTEGSFGRMVAKVTCGDKILNAELLNTGHARMLSQYCSVSEFVVEEWAKYGCEITDDLPEETQCDSSYPDVCILPFPPDLDCSEIAFRNFRVLAPDPHRFDSDKDGIGCEG